MFKDVLVRGAIAFAFFVSVPFSVVAVAQEDSFEAAADDFEDELDFLEEDQSDANFEEDVAQATDSDTDSMMAEEMAEADAESAEAPADESIFEEAAAEESEPAAEPAPAPAVAEAEPASEPAAEPAPNPVDSRPQLDEIIVTAQKRAEDIQDVPLSVTAIGAEDIKEKNMADLNTVQAYAPNLSILATPTFNFIYMRGIGSGYNRGFEQSVAILIDDVFYGRPSYLSNGLLDLASIEILRGPQGTLYGKNSAAGAIHLRTAVPEPDWGLDTDILVGERNELRFRAAVGGPLFNEDFSFRLAVLSETQDGDIRNTSLDSRFERDQNDKVARLKLRWDISPRMDLLWTLTGLTVDQEGSGTQLTFARPRHLAAFRVYDPETTDDTYDQETQQDFPGFVNRDGWDTTVKFDWEVWGETVFSSVSNFAWMDEDVSFDADFSPIPIIVLHNNEDFEQFSQEFRLVSGPGFFEYVAGAFYLNTTINAKYVVPAYVDLAELVALTGAVEYGAAKDFDQQFGTNTRTEVLNDENAGRLAAELTKARQDAEGTPVVEESDKTLEQESDSFALFGQFSWNFTEELKVTVGARVSYEVKTVYLDQILRNLRTGGEGEVFNQNPDDESLDESNFDQSINLNNTLGLGAITFPAIQGGTTQFNFVDEREETNISPKISIQYNWLEDVMTYVTVARGFKGGGYNAQALNITQVEYEEETSTTYEAGLKSQWLGGAARLNVSGFFSEFQDYQISAFNGVAFVVENAADVEITGVEYEALLITPWSILFGISGAWTEAIYTSFPGGPCQAEAVEDAPCDLSGQTLPSVPEWAYTVNLGWEDQVLDLPVRAHVSGSGTYNSFTFRTTDLDPLDSRAEFFNIRAQVGLRSIDDTWSLMLRGENLTDNEIQAGSNDVAVFIGSHFGGRVPTTSYSLEFRLLL